MSDVINRMVNKDLFYCYQLQLIKMVVQIIWVFDLDS